MVDEHWIYMVGGWLLIAVVVIGLLIHDDLQLRDENDELRQSLELCDESAAYFSQESGCWKCHYNMLKDYDCELETHSVLAQEICGTCVEEENGKDNKP